MKGDAHSSEKAREEKVEFLVSNAVAAPRDDVDCCAVADSTTAGMDGISLASSLMGWTGFTSESGLDFSRCLDGAMDTEGSSAVAGRMTRLCRGWLCLSPAHECPAVIK